MRIKYIIVLAATAFLLHLIWENAQAPLYAGYQSLPQYFPICFVSAVGDVVVTLFVLVFISLFKKDSVRKISDFVALSVIGFVVAVAIEQHALLTGEWSYAPAMPLMPWLSVGLTPIAQMIILLPLSFYLAKHICDLKFWNA